MYEISRSQDVIFKYLVIKDRVLRINLLLKHFPKNPDMIFKMKTLSVEIF